MSVSFWLSSDPLKAIVSPSKFVYFNRNLYCCDGRRHDVTYSRQTCYVACSYNIIYTPRSESKIIPISIVGFNLRYHVSHESRSFPMYFYWDNILLNPLHTIQHLISERILVGLLPSCLEGNKHTDLVK